MARFINGQTDYNQWRKETGKTNKEYEKRMGVINEMMTKSTLSLVDEIRLVMVICITTLTDKLDGFFSISTSVLMNRFCQSRAKDPASICSKCYAANGASRYSGLALAIETNYMILNGWLISEEAWKTLQLPTTNGYFRIESHGDVASVTCARNYIRIIRSHSWLNFGIWTKNYNIWAAAFELEGGKPNNCTFIVSSDKVNHKIDLTGKKAAAYADHTFTVYDKEYIKENNVTINCGAKSCQSCINAGCRCYFKDNTDMNEQLK